MLSAVVLLSFFAMLSPQQLFLYLFFAVSIVWNWDALYDGIFKHPLRIPLLLTLFSLFATAVLNGEGGKGVYNAGRFFMENYAYLTVAFVGGLACSLDVFGRCAVCRAKRSGCFLVEAGDKLALQNALERLVNDRDLRIKMGKNAWNDVSERFSGRIVLQELESLYKRLD